MMKLLGSFLKKKRTNRFYGKKKSVPFLRYKSMSGDFNKVKCELYDTIGVAGTTDRFTFQNNGQQYMPLATVLSTSSSFAEYYPDYVRYKITGVRIDLSNCNSPEHLRTIFTYGAPGCAVAFYPQNTTQGMADAPRNKDNNLVVFPNVTSVQSKYWNVPDSLIDTGAGGLGTWNSTNNWSSQTGQLHLAPLETGNNAASSINVFLIRIIVYVTFSTKID